MTPKQKRDAKNLRHKLNEQRRAENHGGGKRLVRATKRLVQELKRSFLEDFAHENGNYFNQCCKCKLLFRGYKRRVVCKECQ